MIRFKKKKNQQKTDKSPEDTSLAEMQRTNVR